MVPGQQVPSTLPSCHWRSLCTSSKRARPGSTGAVANRGLSVPGEPGDAPAAVPPSDAVLEGTRRARVFGPRQPPYTRLKATPEDDRPPCLGVGAGRRPVSSLVCAPRPRRPFEQGTASSSLSIFLLEARVAKHGPKWRLPAPLPPTSSDGVFPTAPFGFQGWQGP